jgi:hypothetical protein
MALIHKSLAEGRWFKFSVLEQMANIGCDVDRAIRWRNKGELEYSNAAFERALELLDFTMADSKNRGPRLKEICRVREVFIDYFMYDNQYKMTDEFWHNYFFDFNYAAAIQRGR